MFSLFDLIQRYIHVLLFLSLELVAFYLVVNYNHTQKEIFLYSSSLVSGYFLERSSRFQDFVTLEKENKELLTENARLLREIINTTAKTPLKESIGESMKPFEVIPANVINQTIHSNRNHFTINRGSSHDVEKSMGIMTSNGVVGIVKQVSENFATVISLLNVDARISATIKDKGYFGTLRWNGDDYHHLQLTGVPKHAEVQVGDVVVTNGYSTIFPRDIPIGTVGNFNLSRDGISYDIEVDIVNDLTQLDYVFVIKNNFASERLSLENE